MPRKKVSAQPPAASAAALKRQIEELQQQLERTAAEERRRRGELMNGYLDGPSGDRLRAVLGDLVAPSDRYLFGLDTPATPPGGGRPADGATGNPSSTRIESNTKASAGAP